VGLCNPVLQIRKCAWNSVSVKKDVYPSKETYKRNKSTVLNFLAIPRCAKKKICLKRRISIERDVQKEQISCYHIFGVSKVCVDFFKRDIYPSKETYKKYT